MQHSNGFSLIETIIIIAIIAIVSILVLPNITTMLNQNQVTQQSHDFVTAVQLALSESETSGNKISICAKNSTSDTCVAYTTVPDKTVWRNGWLIFSDKNDNGIYDSTDTLLKVQANATNTVSITAPASTLTIVDGSKVTRGVGTFDFTPPNCKSNGTHRVKLTTNGYLTIEGVACTS
ncbi:MAG: GspH/FimT family pseudopilin [Gammaproteobacteria bacterium]|nr:GspH/FimT family pseudopilin [Gammaproteobacteria bacterium]